MTMKRTTTTTTTGSTLRCISRTKTVHVRTNKNDRIVSLLYYYFDNINTGCDDSNHHCGDQKEEETATATATLSRMRGVPQLLRCPPVPPILRLISRNRSSSSSSSSSQKYVVPSDNTSTNNNNPAAAALLPNEVLLRICSFLPHDDWLAVDSSCKRWKELRSVLWLEEEEGEGADQTSMMIILMTPTRMSTTQRSTASSYRTAKRQMGTTWNTLTGFLSRRIVLNGPAASESTLSTFVHSIVSPWSLPFDFMASWQHYHNGEWEKSAGLYLGARLLSMEEISSTVRRWKKEEVIHAPQPEHEEKSSNNTILLRIPLFAEHRARQIAMDLILFEAPTTTTKNISSDKIVCHHPRYQQQQQQQHGRIVLISPCAPFGPHVKVLATSWEGFLTLI